MPRSIERLAVRAAACAVVLSSAPDIAQAQESSLFERLNLDRLQLSALGASYGPVRVPRVAPTQVYSLHADYGEITRPWRVVFALSYWDSRLEESAVREFVRQFYEGVGDPAAADTVDGGRVSISDIAVEADMRWTPLRSSIVRPYAGGGVGAHVINAESALFSDTFVERAFDSITVGFAGVVGVELVARRHLAVGVQARYNLLSNLRFGAARVTGTYYFGSRPPPPPS